MPQGYNLVINDCNNKSDEPRPRQLNQLRLLIDALMGIVDHEITMDIVL